MFAPRFAWFAALLVLTLLAGTSPAKDLPLDLRYQQETSPGSGRFHTLHRQESWQPEQTAIIVCDVWDLHHCLNAVRRMEQFLPRLNALLTEARRQGVTIIHAPSDCMDYYAKHPARLRAMNTPQAEKLPADIQQWCSRIPAEEEAVYPLDQSDGGADDDPKEAAEWAKKLTAMGRNAGTPWKKQHDAITIDGQQDYISDRGAEVWSILQERGIQNVMLAGVHTNMCVLGRPFGLRQLSKNGKNVVLVRDLTDTMYNPERWPYVSHFTGTDLIVSHIEKYVAPTITSDQILDGPAFAYAGDKRPHVVIVIAEDEYETEKTLPKFAVDGLGRDFRVSLVFGSDEERNLIPGLDVLESADALLVSIRRRVLPEADLKKIRDFIAAGKPVIGIRTASHAFSLRGKQPPAGYADWPEFDAQVFGGNYHGHHANQLQSTVQVVAEHPIVQGLPSEPFPQGGSLYQTSPLKEGTKTLLIGKIEGKQPEPVAWTFERADGGRSFYTSMGHVKDFENEHFVHLLANGIRWAAGVSPVKSAAVGSDQQGWQLVQVPMEPLIGDGGPLWYRCAVRLPAEYLATGRIRIDVPGIKGDSDLWLNGQQLQRAAGGSYLAKSASLVPGDINLLVIRTEGGQALTAAPSLSAGSQALTLAGRWQFRQGDDSSWSNLPLPAKFGASPDVLFEPVAP